jgi:hypothetical protein
MFAVEPVIVGGGMRVKIPASFFFVAKIDIYHAINYTETV